MSIHSTGHQNALTPDVGTPKHAMKKIDFLARFAAAELWQKKKKVSREYSVHEDLWSISVRFQLWKASIVCRQNHQCDRVRTKLSCGTRSHEPTQWQRCNRGQQCRFQCISVFTFSSCSEISFKSSYGLKVYCTAPLNFTQCKSHIGVNKAQRNLFSNCPCSDGYIQTRFTLD